MFSCGEQNNPPGATGSSFTAGAADSSGKTVVIISSITLMEALPPTLTQAIRRLGHHQSSSKHEDVIHLKILP